MHVKTIAGAKWYDQPIGSLIIAKPHPHEMAEHHKLLYVGGHAFAVPSQAGVYVPGTVDQGDDAEVALADKLVSLGPGGFARISKIDGITKLENTPPEWNPQSAGWKLLPAEKQKIPVHLNGQLAGWAPSDWKLYVVGPQAEAAWGKDPEGHWHVIAAGSVAPASPSTVAGLESHLKAGSLQPYAGTAEVAEDQHPPSPAAPHPGAAAEPIAGVAKINGGTIPVTAGQISSAIEILHNNHSTAVKQPLQKEGHPLWEMDYHAINKATLKEHPELKVPPGTKSKHVGQVKISVMHHLNAKLAELAATAAQHAHAAQAAKDQEEHAEHAQEAAGHTITVAGKEFTTEQAQAALKALEDSSHWKVLAILNDAGSPLGKGTWQGYKTWAAHHPEYDKNAKAGFIAMLQEALGAHEPQVSPDMAKLHDEIAAAAKIPNLIPPSHALPNKHEAIAAALIMSHSDGHKRYVFQGMDGEWLVQVGIPATALDSPYWEVSADHHVTSYADTAAGGGKWATGTTVILWNNGLGALKAKAAAPPEPAAAGLPADVQSLIDKGIGVDVGSAPWGSLLPGGDLVSQAKTHAKAQGFHFYILKLGGEWSYGQGQPSPAEKASGWWDITPIGGVLYYPPEKHLSAPEEPKPFTEEPGWAGLHAEILKAADPGNALQAPTLHEVTGTPGQMVAHLLWATQMDGNTRWFKVIDGKAQLPTALPPAVGTPGHLMPVVYQVKHDHSVTIWSSDGMEHSLTPSDVLAFTDTYFHVKPAEAPSKEKTWADLKPPTLDEAKKLLAEWPPGSTLYQITAPKETNNAGEPGAWYVLKPGGDWGYTSQAGKFVSASPSGFYHDWVAEGGLKPVAVKHNLAGSPVTLVGELPPNEDIPGYAQAAMEKGAVLHGIDPATMPWANKLPGANVVPSALAGLPEDPQGTVVMWYSGIGDWAWEGKHGTTGGDQSKGWWEISPDKEISYHPPAPAAAAGITDDQLLDLAHKAYMPGNMPDTLASKLGKALIHSAKYDDGKIRYVSPKGGLWAFNSISKPHKPEYYSVAGTKVAHYTDDGFTVHALTSSEVAKLLQGENVEPEAKPSKILDSPPAGETAPAIPVAYEGSLAGEVPAGSKLYKYKNSLYNSADTYIHKPDGTWAKVSGPYSVNNMGSVYATKYEGWLQAGKLEEVPPLTPEQVAQYKEAAELKEMIKSGAVDPAAKPGDSEPGALGYAIARAVSEHPGAGEVFVWQDPDDGHWGVNMYAGGLQDYYAINTKTLEGQHYPYSEPPQPVPFAEVKDAIQKWVVPNSVVINKKHYKHGHYYKAKGKAHLEINGEYSSYASQAYKYGPHVMAHYEWHAADGSHKEMTPAAAASWLASGEPQWHAMPKSAEVPLAKPASFASVFKPASTYRAWTAAGPAEVQVHPDGSAVLTGSAGYAGPKSAADVAVMLGKGSLLDGYGNTVVAPGIEPHSYHLFSTNVFYSKLDLQHLLAALEQGGGIPVGEHLDISYGSKNHNDLIKFLADQGAGETAQQYSAIKGLIHELLEIPENKAGAAAPEEIKYLKGLPPGITSPKDIFSLDDLGYAKSPAWNMPGSSGDIASNYYLFSSPDLAAKIKELSQEHGAGKVVGTHISQLTKDERVQWLEAFKQGDMVTVFHLDAKGGKVSPVHPGAPENEATHQIIWGPWATGETPAQMDVPGEWSDYQNVTLPKAEIDNYLIKANLQHAEYLTWQEKRQWVTWHRKKNQAQVDALSRSAHSRWAQGANTVTGPPAWTDDIKPATTYDTYVEDGSAASAWGSQAVTDFTEDHKDDPAFKEAWQQWKDSTASPYSWDSFLGGSYYNKVSVVQAWLDQEAAKAEAEKLKPKYHVEPDPDGYGKALWSRVSDQFGWKGWWRSGDAKFATHELGVAELAKLWGYRTPETRVAELDGEQGIAHNIPAGSTLLDPQPDFTKMTERQLQDIAREHVLGWALDSPSTPGTHYVMADGSIVSGDHSAAYTGDLGHWDGLALNGQENLPGDQLSSRFYQAIMDHQVSHKLADQAYIAAMRAASRISKTPDSRVKKILAPYAQLKAVPLDTDGIVARKNALPDDFAKLWAQVYAKAGWTLPPVPAERLRFGVHSGFSELQFFDHVMAVKSYGTTAFFASPDIQHSSFLVWTELGGKGKDAPRLIRGETALRRTALANLTSWAKAHQTGDQTNLTAPVQAGPPLPVNKGTYYKGVINAAKAVSKHAADQNFEGDWTKKQLTWMETHQAALGEELKAAEDAVAKGPESKEYAAVKTKLGQPEYVVSAAKHYLGLFAQIQQAKDNAGTFSPGDLPDWDKTMAGALAQPKAKEEPAKEEPAKSVLVEKKSVVRELGEIDPSDGELKLGGGKTFGYPGSAWHITLPTGEVIEFQDESSTGTKKAHTGRIRFKADATKGSMSLENVRAFLEGAGVAMPEADDAYMELRYWRHLAGHLGRHSDWQSGKYGKVWADAAKGFGMTPPASQDAAQAMLGSIVDKNMDPAEEAAVWRSAWSNLTSPEQVAKFVDDGGYLPHFKHFDLRHPDAPTGHPVWMRFDYAPGTEQFTGGPGFLAKQPLTHAFQNGIEDGKKIALSGGALSTEGRLRVLGRWITGLSSSSDMTAHGSSGVLYLRGAGYSHSHGNMKLSPRLLAQTSTRAYNSDAWGDVDKALTQSPFSPKTAAGFTPTNETDAEDGASLLDDILMIEAGAKAPEVIQSLKKLGITQIRGLPVEQRIVSSMSASNAELVRAHDAANTHLWFARPEQAWEPPPSDVVAYAAIETEAEQKGKSSDPGALKDETEGLLASAEEPEDVASTAQVSQMFYGQDTKPSSVMSLAPKVKLALAKRLAKEMTSPTDDLQALDAAAGLTYEQDWGSDDRERIIAGLIKAWAQTNSSPIITALQHEAAKLFGLSKKQLSALPGGYAPQTEAAAALENTYGPVLREFLRAQWQLTQEDMIAHGIEDVTLYRIFKWNTPADWAKDAKPGELIDAPPQYAIASWGYLQGSGAEIAGTYGSGAHSIVVKATFPRQLMLSYPKSGFGSYNETEFTVLDAPGQWKVQKVT